MYSPVVGRHASGPAPDPEDERRSLFHAEQPDRKTTRFSLSLLPSAIGMGAAAWAVDRYTQTSLGAWRYVFMVPLTVFTVCGGVFGAVLFGLLLQAKVDADGAPRWLRRAVYDLFSGLFAVLLVGLWVFTLDQLTQPPPRGTLFPSALCAAAFAAGVTAARIRRRRRRLAFTHQPSASLRRAFAVVTICFAAAMPLLLISRVDALALLSAYVVGVFVLTIQIGKLGGPR